MLSFAFRFYLSILLSENSVPLFSAKDGHALRTTEQTAAQARKNVNQTKFFNAN